MENKYLAKILPFLNEIEKERREQFEGYFRTAPMWLMDTFVVEELEKGTVNIKIPALGSEVYKLVYLGKNISYALSTDRCFCKISSKFEEPNPSAEGRMED